MKKLPFTKEHLRLPKGAKSCVLTAVYETGLVWSQRVRRAFPKCKKGHPLEVLRHRHLFLGMHERPNPHGIFVFINHQRLSWTEAHRVAKRNKLIHSTPHELMCVVQRYKHLDKLLKDDEPDKKDRSVLVISTSLMVLQTTVHMLDRQPIALIEAIGQEAIEPFETIPTKKTEFVACSASWSNGVRQPCLSRVSAHLGGKNLWYMFRYNY